MHHTAVRVAAVQATPAYLDREATLDRADALVDEAASSGAKLIVFPEAFVPGYPDFVWRLPAWSDGSWYRRLAENSVTVPGPAVDRLAAAARRSGAWIVMGVTERTPSGTLHNTLLHLAPDGGLAGLHRKLVATGGERTVWGPGDGSTLRVLQTPFGRLGGLICWENLMPLARAALYEQGVDIWVAPTWDNSDAWPATLRHVAREGRVFVIGTNS
ncbi:MAG TPA: carbon-nitrogen hydrolase family protein, partial [Candidatus Dormibacteraeota bacterium]|nr:carbon-nitrogen hydrolase family protein [Candidatus Dormibacteraeota bacterium]